MIHSVPSLKRITVRCGQHSTLSLEETDYNFISLNKSGLGKEISDFSGAAFANGKEIITCVFLSEALGNFSIQY